MPPTETTLGEAAGVNNAGRAGITVGIAAVIARGGEEGDSLMSGGGYEGAVISAFAAKLVLPPAHGNDRNTREIGGRRHGGVEVPIIRGIGFNNNDIGGGCDGMRPFDIQGLLEFPVAEGVAGTGGISPGEVGRLPILVQFGEAGGIRQTNGGIELGKVAGGEVGIGAVDEAGVVIRIDDGDGLPAAVAGGWSQT